MVDELMFFLKGVLVGLLASMPPGPVMVMCLQRTLNRNGISGLVSGLGAASADTLFAIMALFSLSMVMSFIESHTLWLKALGGLMVIFIGLSIYRKNPVMQMRKNRTKKGNLLGDFISIFLLTFTNPAYILAFVALFAAVGLGDHPNLLSGVLMIMGVLIGAASWWLLLTFVVSSVRHKFRLRHLVMINKICGIVIMALGVIAILSLVFNLAFVDKIIPS